MAHKHLMMGEQVSETQSAESDAPECVRCWVEEGQDVPATMRVLHPYGGNALPVCERHGDDLLANRWTRVIPPGVAP